jgi:hypothetical protein
MFGQLQVCQVAAPLICVCALLHCHQPAAGIVRVLRDLDKQARKQGGAVYMLNGNHESLNVCGDFRCVRS